MRGWDRMWSAITAKYGDPECRHDGAAWEYMGTDDGEHVFQHRDLNGEGRVYERVAVEPGDFEEAG